MSSPYLLLNVTAPLAVELFVVALLLGVTSWRDPPLFAASVPCGVLAVLLRGIPVLLGLTIP
ncbi:hypothetical protein DAETH_31130 [Deinococcus aetherius]|uniref:Uncharacterized protein n=1 Tax=Deinococcus aetherius TaxID=200252 RepID=A0ABN6RJU2_9DEIO|nr:hypothetical protein [Deinococcus aetherius]BDP43144.1 hypothetical protein DAETH_31130 [Deinococcus aetherius]